MTSTPFKNNRFRTAASPAPMSLPPSYSPYPPIQGLVPYQHPQLSFQTSSMDIDQPQVSNGHFSQRQFFSSLKNGGKFMLELATDENKRAAFLDHVATKEGDAARRTFKLDQGIMDAEEELDGYDRELALQKEEHQREEEDLQRKLQDLQTRKDSVARDESEYKRTRATIKSLKDIKQECEAALKGYVERPKTLTPEIIVRILKQYIDLETADLEELSRSLHMGSVDAIDAAKDEEAYNVLSALSNSKFPCNRIVIGNIQRYIDSGVIATGVDGWSFHPGDRSLFFNRKFNVETKRGLLMIYFGKVPQDDASFRGFKCMFRNNESPWTGNSSSASASVFIPPPNTVKDATSAMHGAASSITFNEEVDTDPLAEIKNGALKDPPPGHVPNTFGKPPADSIPAATMGFNFGNQTVAAGGFSFCPKAASTPGFGDINAGEDTLATTPSITFGGQPDDLNSASPGRFTLDKKADVEKDGAAPSFSFGAAAAADDKAATDITPGFGVSEEVGVNSPVAAPGFHFGGQSANESANTNSGKSSHGGFTFESQVGSALTAVTTRASNRSGTKRGLSTRSSSKRARLNVD